MIPYHEKFTKDHERYFVGWMIFCEGSDYEAIVSLVRQRVLERGLLSYGCSPLPARLFLHCTTPLQLGGPRGRRVPKE